MLYEEAKRQTYMGLPYEDFQWLEQMYLDYGYLNQSEFWEAFNALLKELHIDAPKFFELSRRFDYFRGVADSYFYYYPVLGRIARLLSKTIIQVAKHDKEEGGDNHAS